MLGNRLGHCLALTALGCLAACGSGRSNASPRLATIPPQTTGGGATFSLDLAKFVTDREGDPISYQVVSGGGSFNGSLYSNLFDTLGTYTVTFTVNDSEGKKTSGTFTVKVTTAVLALVRAGTDLQLVDTGSNKVFEITNTLGVTYNYKAVLTTGHVVFERVFGGRTGLYVYDPGTAQTTNLGDSSEYDYNYRAKTSTNQVVFTRTSVANSADTDLFIWNSIGNLSREIAAGANVFEGNPIVTSGNLVFYELGVGAGQRDIYYFDPSDNDSTKVSDNSNAEALQAALPNGAVVFTRVGGGGETDLFYFKVETGTVEIGADQNATVQSQSKTYGGVTSNSIVAFEVTATGSKDFYAWNPATGTSRAVATDATRDETFAGSTALNEIVFNELHSVGNVDLWIYNWATNTATQMLADNASNEIFKGSLTASGDVVFELETGAGGDDLYVYDTSGGAPATGLVTVGNDDYVFNAVLDTDKVAYTRLGGSGGVFIIEPGPLTIVTVSNIVGSTYGGLGTASGDVVAIVPQSGQDDLFMWDESAGSTVSISTVAGDDAYGAKLSSGKIVFTRVVTGQTNADLFVWTETGATEARVTTTADNHTVVTAFDATAN